MALEPENHISLVGPKPGACTELAPRTEAHSNTIALSQPLSENIEEVVGAERYSATSKLSHHPTTENSARAKVLLKTNYRMCPETASSEISVLGGTDAPRLAIPTLHLPDRSDSTPIPPADLWHTTHSTRATFRRLRNRKYNQSALEECPRSSRDGATNDSLLPHKPKPNQSTPEESSRSIPHQAPRSRALSMSSIPRPTSILKPTPPLSKEPCEDQTSNALPDIQINMAETRRLDHLHNPPTTASKAELAKISQPLLPLSPIGKLPRFLHS